MPPLKIKSEKFTIVLDQDDILTQTYQRWLDRYNEDWDDELTLEALKGWNTHYWVRPECGKKIYEYLSEPKFYRGMEPVEGSIEGAKSLVDAGHDVVVATASPVRSHTAVEEKKDWMREHMPFISLDNFMVIHRKELLSAADILFDDGAHNLRDFPKIAICLRRPWNRGEDCADLYVDDWRGFLEEIERMMDDRSHLHRMRCHPGIRLSQLDDSHGEEWRYER